jgi:predicted DNA binding CopG/RHH family protein
MPKIVERNKKMTLVKRMEDIPNFVNDAEEQTFWETHALAPELYSKNNNGSLLELPLPKSKLISLRLERDLDKRLRHLAKQKGTSYQTLLKEFVLERVYEEEKRLGII